ncbi:putative lysine decarboxylase [Coniophora puteana RWD-64-598 SS2]|uniref:Putative lysine decarboxylase n=1 Tax=Coniophora puteana (strain RWD-64-598) TaxID=741705 RepID=A0A5M3MN50_CONPW|nr:putative lysine decarboxylase [Coniophora puteana RWD-64-598 SS2]EIW80523.1 putative lysine decarboxylase [Coniophora puteana RWD-64-598 SS2]
MANAPLAGPPASFDPSSEAGRKLKVRPSTERAVAVYCASSLGKSKAFQNAALSVGHALADADRPLVYGGGNTGLMGTVSGAVLEHENGRVIGVSPWAMVDAEGRRTRAISLSLRPRRLRVYVSTMHERKVEMAKRVGSFIGLPGGFGSWDEILEVVTWNQLNIHNKAVVILNVCGYYDSLRSLIKRGIAEGFIRPESENLVTFVDGPEDHAEHEMFNWGKAAIHAIESWDAESIRAYPFQWLDNVDTSAPAAS